jgi:polar amino acid transport system substrate-binding protein
MLKKLALTALVGFGLTMGGQAVANDDLAKVKDNKAMTFAMSGNYPPFNFVNDKGELDGFDVEIGKEISKRIGVDGKPIATAWDGIIAGLLANRYEAIIGSMAITEERLKAIDFSETYYRDGAQLFVKKGGDTSGIDAMKGKKIGVTLGTTFEKWVRENAPDVEVRTYKGVPQMMLELGTGRLDGFITGRLIGLMAIKDKGAPVALSGELLYTEQVAIALRQKNPELKAAINKAIADMKSDGTYEAISTKYFGSDIR